MDGRTTFTGRLNAFKSMERVSECITRYSRHMYKEIRTHQ